MYHLAELLEEHKLWINFVKFPAIPVDIYKRHADPEPFPAASKVEESL
jgi:hypothetical protein